MTPEQEQLVDDLVLGPGPVPQELLDAFGAPDGPSLCRDLLTTAADDRSADHLYLALTVAFRCAPGPDRSALPALRRLAHDPWHDMHDDVATLLEEVGGAEVVDELDRLAWSGDDFQGYEGSTELTRNVVHALGRIATPEALAALVRLRAHPAQEVRDVVRHVESRTTP